ncbi:MAG: hypothetical protein K5837_04715 [Candidatus Saccharibacteria bacterium]|nr:hypothetical protein [Candidatus Saccharibacteria bacterium]
MSKESSPNSAENQDQGPSNYEQVMAGAVAFNAAEASARAAEYRKQKADQEAADKAAAEAEAEQRKQAYEDRKAQERAEAEERARQHQEAWEARQENHDYPTEILDTFMSNINEAITEATKDGQETADFTREVTIYYGPGYADFDRKGIASTLTGKEANGGSPDVVCEAAIDSVINKDPDNKDYDGDIRGLATEQMPAIKAKLEEAGYLVQTDAKTGIITSIAWGEEAARITKEMEEAAKESEKPAQTPAKQQSAISRFFSRLRGKN